MSWPYFLYNNTESLTFALVSNIWSSGWKLGYYTAHILPHMLTCAFCSSFFLHCSLSIVDNFWNIGSQICFLNIFYFNMPCTWQVNEKKPAEFRWRDRGTGKKCSEEIGDQKRFHSHIPWRSIHIYNRLIISRNYFASELSVCSFYQPASKNACL